MTVYYYDPVSGSNAANGLTPGTARQTLAFANSNHAAGDTIAIRNDRLFTENIVFVPAGNNVVYTSYDPDTGALFAPGMARPTHRPTSNRNVQDGGAVRTGIQIKGLIFDQITGSQQNVTFTGASTDCLLEDCDLINCPDYPCQWNHTGADRITIRRCNLRRIGESAIVLYGDDCLVEDCVLYDFGYTNATGAHGIYTKGQRATIRDNVLMGFTPANSGITFRRTGSVVVRNLIMNSTTGAAAIDWYWEEQDTNTEGVSIVARNRIFNVGIGLYNGPPNSNIVLNQTVSGAVNAGGLIRLTVTTHGRATGDKVFVQNVGGVPNATGYWTITNSGANTVDLQGSTFAGTYTSGGTLQRVTRDKLLIFNNTIDLNGLSGGNTGQAFDFSDSFAAVCSIAFFNNVVMNCTSRYARWGTKSTTAGNTWTMDYNTYYPGTGSLYAFGGFLDTFANYKAMSGVGEDNSTQTNPAFAKGGPDFAPTSGGATVDAGTASIDAAVTLAPDTRVAYDHLGYSGAAPDRGALEWEPSLLKLRPAVPDQNIALDDVLIVLPTGFAVPTTFGVPTVTRQGGATIVQTKTGKVDAGANGVDLPLTFDAPTTPGNAIIVSVSGWNTGNNALTFSVTDNKGNTYSTPPGGVAQTPGQAFLQQFYCVNAAGGSTHTVTVDSNVGNYLQAELMEVSGLEASSPLDTSVENGIQGFASTSTTGAITATGTDFIVAAMSEDGGFTVSAVTAPYTESYDGNTGQPLHTAWAITGSGSSTATFTMSGSAGTGAVALALKIAPVSVGPSPQTINPTGFVLAPSYGTPTIQPGAVTISPAGFVQTPTFGVPKLGLTVTASGLVVPSTFGVPKLDGQVRPTGFVQTATFGVPKFGLVVAPAGFLQTAVFGVPKLGLDVRPLGFALPASYGVPRLDLQARPVGFALPPTFGVPTLQPGGVTISPSGLLIPLTFGAPTLVPAGTVVSPAGFVLPATFGVPTLAPGGVIVSPAGFTVPASFGVPTFQFGGVTISPTGFVLAPSFGVPKLGQEARPVGFVLPPTFGVPTILPGGVTITPLGAIFVAAFGTPRIDQQVRPAGFSAGVSFGVPSFVTGGVTISPSGFVIPMSFGVPAFDGSTTISPAGFVIPTSFGTPSLVPAGVSISPAGFLVGSTYGLPSLGLQARPTGLLLPATFGVPKLGQQVRPTGSVLPASFGVPSFHLGGVVISPAGFVIPSSFGVPVVQAGGAIVQPAGFVLTTTFGVPQLLPGPVTVSPAGLVIGSTFGVPTLQMAGVTISPSGFVIGSTFGVPSITYGGAVVAPSGFVIPVSFGTPALVPGNVNVFPAGFVIPISFGTPTNPQSVFPSGFSVPTAIGLPKLHQTIPVAGLSVPLSFGVPRVDFVVRPSGLLVPISFGQPRAESHVHPQGFVIPSTFGTPSLVGEAVVSPVGFLIPVVFGVPTLGTGGRPIGFDYVYALVYLESAPFALVETEAPTDAYALVALEPAAYAVVELEPVPEAAAELEGAPFVDERQEVLL